MSDKPEPEQIQEEFNEAVKNFQAQERVRDAAPDLLEALQNIINGIQTGAIVSDYDETLENAVIKAHNAISKAID